MQEQPSHFSKRSDHVANPWLGISPLFRGPRQASGSHDLDKSTLFSDARGTILLQPHLFQAFKYIFLVSYLRFKDPSSRQMDMRTNRETTG